MRFFTVIIIFLCTTASVNAQIEALHPVNFNPNLFYNSGISNKQLSNFRNFTVQDNLIFFSDTLALPFNDEFSKNFLRPVNFPGAFQIVDTLLSTGSCLDKYVSNLLTREYMNDTSWNYSFNTVTQKTDSTPKLPINIRVFNNNSNCFRNGTLLEVWPLYHKYSFDSTSGNANDSSLVTADTSLQVQDLIFSVIPSSALWMDNSVYLNSTYPINPLSIGVATLDGLNEFGLPYNKINATTYGNADHLTSKPINLSGLTESDSVYLSFYYQAKGLGNKPEPQDSLMVQFREKIGGNWITVWSIPGYLKDSDIPPGFIQEFVLLKDQNLSSDPIYFYSGFQFRFVNKASLSGNNDHWHLDYVRFDKNRSVMFPLVDDISIVTPIPSLLNEYSLKPWDHFDQNTDLLDSVDVSVSISNPGNSSGVNWIVTADELISSQNIFNSGPGIQFNVPPFATRSIFPKTYDYSLLSGNKEIHLVTKFSTSPTNPSANKFLLNDTVESHQLFTNILAYDDGSAERAYGLEGLGIKKFAYEFNIDKPDTLAAIQIHFSNIDVPVSNLLFSMFIWDSVELNNVFGIDSVIYTLDNKKPQYIDSTNGFATFVLDSTIVVDGKFYIGWSQTDERNLQIGYDLNSTKGFSKMFAFKSGIWSQTTINVPGSPMIRILLDDELEGFNTGIKNPVVQYHWNRILTYPNPASSFIRFDVPKYLLKETVKVFVYNSIGEIVKINNLDTGGLSIDELSNGIYVVRIIDEQTNKIYTSKFIKLAR